MKYLLLWFVSGFLIYIIVPPLIAAVPQFQQELFSVFSGVIPLYTDQMKVFSVVLSGLFVVFLSMLDSFLRPRPVLQPQQNARPAAFVPVNSQVLTSQGDPAASNPRTITRRVPRTNSMGTPHLELRSFKLIAHNGINFRLSKGDDLTSKEKFRPVIEIRVNNPELVGKVLPLQFDLINPDGKMINSLRLMPILKRGRNIIVPDDSEFEVSSKEAGVWAMKLLYGQHLWGRLIFTMLGQSISNLSSHIGADMEMDGEALLAANEVTRNFTLEDLLRL